MATIFPGQILHLPDKFSISTLSLSVLKVIEKDHCIPGALLPPYHHLYWGLTHPWRGQNGVYERTLNSEIRDLGSI